MITQRQMSLYDYFNQGEFWQPKQPSERVRIADMDLEWRYNASRWLERPAAHFADLISWAQFAALLGFQSSGLALSDHNADCVVDSMLRNDEERERDPLAWLRSTALYRALVADLPDCSVQLDAIAERAKHWADCPVRSGGGDCRCEDITPVEVEAA